MTQEEFADKAIEELRKEAQNRKAVMKPENELQSKFMQGVIAGLELAEHVVSVLQFEEENRRGRM